MVGDPAPSDWANKSLTAGGDQTRPNPKFQSIHPLIQCEISRWSVSRSCLDCAQPVSSWCLTKFQRLELWFRSALRRLSITWWWSLQLSWHRDYRQHHHNFNYYLLTPSSSAESPQIASIWPALFVLCMDRVSSISDCAATKKPFYSLKDSPWVCPLSPSIHCTDKIWALFRVSSLKRAITLSFDSFSSGATCIPITAPWIILFLFSQRLPLSASTELGHPLGAWRVPRSKNELEKLAVCFKDWWYFTWRYLAAANSLSWNKASRSFLLSIRKFLNWCGWAPKAGSIWPKFHGWISL